MHGAYVGGGGNADEDGFLLSSGVGGGRQKTKGRDSRVEFSSVSHCGYCSINQPPRAEPMLDSLLLFSLPPSHVPSRHPNCVLNLLSPLRAYDVDLCPSAPSVSLAQSGGAVVVLGKHESDQSSPPPNPSMPPALATRTFGKPSQFLSWPGFPRTAPWQVLLD